MTRPRRLLPAAVLFLAVAQAASAGNYSWTTTGPEPGRIEQIVVDPNDSDTIYVVIPNAGMYRTRDRGSSWVPAYEGIPYGSVYSLASDPNLSGVLYAASGFGVFKTTDGAVTWTARNVGLTDTGINTVAVAPSLGTVLFAGTYGGLVFRSTDAGETWSTASSGLTGIVVYSIAVDPNDPDIAFASTPDGLFKTTTGGAVWVPSGSGITSRVFPIAIDPQDSQVIYAGTENSGVFKSTDGGASWVPRNTGLSALNVLDMAIDPAMPEKLFLAAVDVGPSGLFVTTDGAGQWTRVESAHPSPHAANSVTIDPSDSNRIYAGIIFSGARGTFRRSTDGGGTWDSADQGLSGALTPTVVASPIAKATAFTASSSRVFRTEDGGDQWSFLGEPGYAPNALLIDPADPQVLYAPTNIGVFKSIDGGSGWMPSNGGLADLRVHSLALDPGHSNVLYAGTPGGVFKSTDSGGLWAATPDQPAATSISAIAVSDTSIYVGAGSTTAGLPGLFQSNDAGASWTPAPGVPAAAGWTDIAIHPTNPSIVYALHGWWGIYKTEDGGSSWSSANSGLREPPWMPLRLRIDRASPEILYTTDYASIYRSTNSAETWSLFAMDVGPGGQIFGFDLDPTGRILYASTYGGVYQFERSYRDVPDAHPFWSFIDALAMNRVTAGCGGGNFCPAAPTSRAEAAPLLLKAKLGATFTPAPATGTLFADVPASAFAAAWIEEFSRQAITSGCGGGNFCPDAPVLRADAAVLLLRAKHGSTYAPPPATGAIFADVPADSFAAAWIEALYAEGITSGCGGGNFCPEAAVTRGQMAVFLVRTFGLE